MNSQLERWLGGRLRRRGSLGHIRLLLIPSCFCLAVAAWLFSASELYAGTDVSGTIVSDTTWTVAGSPYNVLGGALTIASNVTLSIQPGVTVNVPASNPEHWVSVQGALQADGCAFNITTFDGWQIRYYAHLVFQAGSSGWLRGCTASGGGWIDINSGGVTLEQSDLSGCSLSIAGSATVRQSTLGGVAISSGAPILETNNCMGTLAISSPSIVHVHANTFTNTSLPLSLNINSPKGGISGNTYPASSVVQVWGAVSGSVSLGNLDGLTNYSTAVGGIAVPAGATLTMQPGLSMTIPSCNCSGYNIWVQGVMRAEGCAFNITRTDGYGYAGPWYAHLLFDAGSGGWLRNCSATGTGWIDIGSADVSVEQSDISGCQVSISGSATVRQSTLGAVTISAGAPLIENNNCLGTVAVYSPAVVQVHGNTFTNTSLPLSLNINSPKGGISDNTYRASSVVQVWGAVSGSVSLGTLDGLTNYSTAVGGVAVPAGATLTMQPGLSMTIPSCNCSGYNIWVQGAMRAEGCAFNITRMDGYGSGPWYAHLLFDAGSSGWLRNCSATGTGWIDIGSADVSVEQSDISGCQVSISGSATVRQSTLGTVSINSGAPVLEGNLCLATISVAGSAVPAIHYCRFPVEIVGVNNTGTSMVDARYNDWGSPSGPGPVGPGSGARVSERVLYDPWLGTIAGDLDHQLGDPAAQATTGSSADPVNTATGNFTHEETDLMVASVGPPLRFTRSYNSRAGSAGPSGLRWTHNYNIWLIDERQLAPGRDSIAVGWSDGRVDRYVERTDGGASVCLPLYPGMFDQLNRTNDGWLLKRKDHTSYRFNTAGQCTQIMDRNDNSITLSYNANYKLQAVTDPAGRQLTFHYNGNDLLDQVTDPAGRTVGFVYAQGRLDTVTDVLGNTIRYTYDANGYLESVTDQRGVRTVFNVYDGWGRVLRQCDSRTNWTGFAYGAPIAGDTTLTNALGRRTIHTHTNFLLTKITYPNAATVSYSYDTNQNRTSITDRNGNTVRFEHDSRGNVTRTTAPDSGVTTLAYADGRFPDLPTRKTDALDVVMEWEYDEHGNVLVERRAVGTPLQCQKSWSYNSWGQVSAQTNELGHATRYDYDTTTNRAGLLLSATDAEGQQTWYDYDTLWRRVMVTDARGSGPGDTNYTTRYYYDNGDRLTNVLGPITSRAYAYDHIGNRTLVRDGNGNERAYEYDQNSNLRFIREPLGRVTEYRYDALNRKAGSIDPNGHETDYAYDAMDSLTNVTRKMYGDGPDLAVTYTRDAHGNALAETDASGRTMRYAYDAIHRKVAQTNDLGHVWRWQYDKLGRVTNSVDATGQSVRNTYDALGRLSAVITFDDLGQPQVTRYDYDLTGNLTRITDAGGRKTEKDYNHVGWLTVQRDGLTNEHHYAYDAVGNQTSILDANGSLVTMIYDRENRLKEIRYPDTTQVTFAYDANGNRLSMADPTGTTAYGYDALDRLTNTVDGFGARVGYGYDLAGNRTTLAYPGSSIATNAYDAANRLRSVTDWQGRATRYDYDSAGRLTQMRYPNGIENNRSYDPAGRLSAMDYRLSGTNVITYAWTRDAEGNPLTQTEDGTLPPTISNPSQVSSQHDSDNRLTSSSEGLYLYDRNGNLTNRFVNGTNTAFAYDFEDRLVRQATGGNVVQHVYDGGGYRIARIENGVTNSYLLDRGRSMSHVLCEAGGDGNVTARYLHGPQIIARLGADGPVRYLLTDAVGNVVALADESGNITDHYAYLPFGESAGQEGTTVNPFRYVGGLGVMAEADGLCFMRARFFDSQTGRFSVKDPFSGTLGEPKSLARYPYAFANPVVYGDPNGKEAISTILWCAAVGVVENFLWSEAGLQSVGDASDVWSLAHGNPCKMAGVVAGQMFSFLVDYKPPPGYDPNAPSSGYVLIDGRWRRYRHAGDSETLEDAVPPEISQEDFKRAFARDCAGAGTTMETPGQWRSRMWLARGLAAQKAREQMPHSSVMVNGKPMAYDFSSGTVQDARSVFKILNDPAAHDPNLRMERVH